MRPDDWDNPHKEGLDPIPFGMYSGIIPVIIRLQNASFEAGADLLVESGWREVPSAEWLSDRYINLGHVRSEDRGKVLNRLLLDYRKEKQGERNKI